MIKKLIRKEILNASKEAGYIKRVDFSIENPPSKDLGDFSTNIAFALSSIEKKNPKEIAENILSKLSDSKIIKKATIAGAGFINIIMQNHTCHEELSEIIDQGKNYGKLDIGNGKKASIDYISANPTGPVHIGNARGGPIGEAIANLLEYIGYKVIREFYLNNVGVQINRLGETLYYWIEQGKGNETKFPEEGYQGEYIKDIAIQISDENKDKLDQFKDKDEVVDYLKETGLNYLIENIKKEVELLNIKFDLWVSEKELQSSGITEKVIERLKDADSTIKREGALWFKNDQDPNFEDKESVLQKSDQDKSYTYFADDIAYHMKRYDEGFDLIVDIWGSNHHGHVPRMMSALKSLSVNENKLKVLLYQFVRIKNGDDIIKMSKRSGNFVTLGQVLEGGVTPDAFKYFILAQNSNTPIDFDIKLASDKSENNPVYYVQYAHVRICSILRKSINSHSEPPVGGEESIRGSAIPSISLRAGKSGMTQTSDPSTEPQDDNGAGAPNIQDADLTLLKSDKELNLIKALIEWPDIVEEVSNNYQIQALPHYAYKIASLFHDFYTNCQVLSEDKKLTDARLTLVNATKIILNIVLNICDITAPVKM